MKSNLGHAQAAAGALGLAKVLLAAEHSAVPATLHVDDRSREIDWEAQGLRLAEKLDAVACPARSADRRGIGVRDERHEHPHRRRGA